MTKALTPSCDNRLQCAPNFLVVTPPRTASTWLYHNLSAHPEIFIPNVKEVKYFSNYWKMCDPDWYLGCFKEGGDKKKGEVSPSYSILPDERIRAIKQMSPELQIVMAFRDPVERSWSHAKHQFRLKESVFAYYEGTASEVSEGKWLECLANSWTAAYSDYLSIVKRWAAIFPKEAIHIHFYESMMADPQSALKEIFNQIQVAQNVRWDSFPYSEKINQGIAQDMSKNCREFLTASYAGAVQEFAGYVADQFGVRVPQEWEPLLKSPKTKKETAGFYFKLGNDQRLLSDILERESAQSTHVQLLLDGYKGYKVFAFKGECLALSPAIEGLDLVRTSRSQIEKYKREGHLIACSTLAEAREEIDKNLRRAEELKNRIQQKDDIIEEKRKAIEEKAARILELQGILEKLTETSKQASDSKSSRIIELEKELEAREVLMQGTQKELAAIIQRTHMEIENLKEELQRFQKLAQELETLKSTRWYRLAKMFDRKAAETK